MEKSKQGKKNREAVRNRIRGKKARESGARFERKVRFDLESKGWIVDRWTNNVQTNKLVPARSRFGLRTTGFPDFIAYKKEGIYQNKIIFFCEGVECKSRGYLTKEEKAKLKWYISQHIFSEIYIAKKGKKRGQIEYIEFK